MGQDGFHIGGAERDRTVGLLNAIQALSQLSYSPMIIQSNTAQNMLSNPIFIDIGKSFFYIGFCAGVVKLVDARDSKSREPKAHVGSIPTSGTKKSGSQPIQDYPLYNPTALYRGVGGSGR